MIRFILFLFGKQGYENCKSCETLKLQLALANEEKKQLTDTLLNIIKPKIYEAPAQELKPIINSAGLFSRRRAALESADREAARIQRDSTIIGKRDDELKNIKLDSSVEQLEEELGIKES